MTLIEYNAIILLIACAIVMALTALGVYLGKRG